jgi:hypothetical protein
MHTALRRRLSLSRSLLAACLVLAGAAREARGQEGVPWRGVVVGVVRDPSGAPVAAARVTVLGVGVGAVSDDSGAFRLTGLPDGPVTVHARRLGYAPASLVVTLATGEVRNVAVVLAAATETLDTVDVRADPMRGKMGGFNGRRERGIGTFLTRDDIVRRRAGRVSQLLRYLPGVYIPQDNSDMRPSTVGMRRAAGISTRTNCVVQLYVDGQHYPDGRLDDFRPAELEGIEIYKSASEIPAVFRSRDTMCGVIALWTRDPDAARREP